jgi:hypothetical protein
MVLATATCAAYQRFANHVQLPFSKPKTKFHLSGFSLYGHYANLTSAQSPDEGMAHFQTHGRLFNKRGNVEEPMGACVLMGAELKPEKPSGLLIASSYNLGLVPLRKHQFASWSISIEDIHSSVLRLKNGEVLKALMFLLPAGLCFFFAIRTSDTCERHQLTHPCSFEIFPGI